MHNPTRCIIVSHYTCTSSWNESNLGAAVVGRAKHCYSGTLQLLISMCVCLCFCVLVHETDLP